MKKEAKKQISLEEKKSVQLEMLKEIDAFCRENNIRYSLAFGTLLGAIRHKGFIPWDDDVDIMMPLPDMLRFKKMFCSKTIKYCDVDTEKYYEFGFSRLANIDTYNQTGIIAKSYGVCIDLYPIVAIPKEIKERDSFFQKATVLFEHRIRLMKWKKQLVRYFPVKTIPGFKKAMKDYRDYMLNTYDYGSTGEFYIVAGRLSIRNRTMYDFDLFEDMMEVDFEGSKFWSISKYDFFLTLMYGDYMTPPPENQRHPYHGGHYYWK